MDDIKLAGKKQNIDPMWKVLNKEVDLGRTNIFPWSCILGVYSKTMWNKQRYCWQLQSHVWIANFRGVNWKISIPWEFSYSIMVLWYGKFMQRSVVERYCELANKTTQQLCKVSTPLHRWPSFQRGRIEICWRIVTSMLPGCPELLLLGTCWTTWCSVVSEQTCTIDHEINPKLFTSDYVVWSLTFITHVNTNCIVMWETLPHIAGWDCFKTPILQEIFWIQKIYIRWNTCAFLEVIRLFQSVGCARNWFQFHTVQQNPKSYLLTLDWDWTGFPLSIYGIWLFWSLETRLRTMIERGNPLSAVNPITSQFAKPTKNFKKTNKRETMIKRGHPLSADSGRASSEIPEWLQEFKEFLVDDEVPERRDSHASSSHEVSLEPTSKRREVLGKHSVCTHFPKDRNCEICQRTKITRAPCRRRHGGAVTSCRNFWWLDMNLETIIDTQSWCKTWQHSGDNHTHVETKTAQETQNSLQKFLEPDRKPKVIHTDNSLVFGKACEDLSWNHCTSTPHRSETNGIAERAVRRVKEGTSAVLLQLGLNESWWADFMECYTYLRNVTDLLSDGKTP